MKELNTKIPELVMVDPSFKLVSFTPYVDIVQQLLEYGTEIKGHPAVQKVAKL